MECVSGIERNISQQLKYNYFLHFEEEKFHLTTKEKVM
jgi:hypothetical protein